MKKFIIIVVLVVLFAGLTAGGVTVAMGKVNDCSLNKNTEKTALVQQRLDETLQLLETLSHSEYIRSKDVTYTEKAGFLTSKNNDETLGYMMVRILDGDINIYREDIGLASNLGSRDYMQRLYTTGESQVTDAFLAGADGKTINYTVTVGILEDGKVTSALMAAIYGSQIDEFLQDDDSVNVLVGSQLQYMGGISEDRFGLAVAQVLEAEQSTSRPVENILLDFYEKKSGSFWGLGDGIQHYTYSPIANSSWIVMTEVEVMPIIQNIVIVYSCALLVLIVAAAVVLLRSKAKERTSGESSE